MTSVVIYPHEYLNEECTARPLSYFHEYVKYRTYCLVSICDNLSRSHFNARAQTFLSPFIIRLASYIYIVFILLVISLRYLHIFSSYGGFFQQSDRIFTCFSIPLGIHIVNICPFLFSSCGAFSIFFSFRDLS